jgi:hypothetical protein
MLLDVALDNESLTITIDDPFHFDMDSVLKEIEEFVSSRKAALNGTDVRGLILQMIKGIAGCEGGCPANARSLVERGYGNFDLKYIEGGILSAMVGVEGGAVLSLKMFPEF